MEKTEAYVEEDIRMLLYEQEGYYNAGQVTYDREKETINFFNDESNTSRYYVRCSQIRTPHEQILFLDHIAGKGFLTEKVLKEFFECLKIAGLMPKRSTNRHTF